MVQPTQFALYPAEGIDVTQQYNVSASVTPETPAPPFQLGLPCFANNGAEFVFVQASTSISLGDFVTITNSLQANSMTSTNLTSSTANRLGMASATAKGSVTYIPAGGYFWACLRGTNQPGNAGTTAPATPQVVQLYASSTVGAVSSVTAGQLGIVGVIVVSSVEPYFDLSWPRTINTVGASIVPATFGNI
jgi:hypothetical protein